MKFSDHEDNSGYRPCQGCNGGGRAIYTFGLRATPGICRLCNGTGRISDEQHRLDLETIKRLMEAHK